MRITNRDDAYIHQSMIRFVERRENNTPEGLEHLKEMKRELRRWYHRPDSNRKCLKWNDYGYETDLVKLPDWIQSEEEAEEWFNYHERREYVPSQWDCTGQVFTIRYKMVNRNGRWYCYHHTAMDI